MHVQRRNEQEMSSSVNSISWQDVNQTQTQGSTPSALKGSDYTTTSNNDTVQLSTGAQVHQLSQQGYSEKEIASEMGLTLKEVQNYLGDDLTQQLAELAAATTSTSKSS